MSEALRLADQLETHARGRTEWRVQDPVSKAYCISFDQDSSLSPASDAREWLSSHISNHPNSPKAKYEIGEVRCFTDLEEGAQQAATLLRTQAARIAELEAEVERLKAREKACATIKEGEVIALVRMGQELAEALGLNPLTASPADIVAAARAIEAAKEAK